LNSLIFPTHEQHHNNSFLIAATIEGQSNIAAGATIGSNHNSRGADGELKAGRGFWPALCTSLKHNSRFAPFTLLTKADYPAELDIPFPFALVSNDVSNDQLVIMPAYWLMYNQYALERNTWKYQARDKRTEKTQFLESHYLAPDTINSIFEAIKILELLAGQQYCEQHHPGRTYTDAELRNYGVKYLLHPTAKPTELNINNHTIENSNRIVKIRKPSEAYQTYSDYVTYYALNHIIDYGIKSKSLSQTGLTELLFIATTRQVFENAGGQLIPVEELAQLKNGIVSYEIVSWKQIHDFFITQGKTYQEQKFMHAIASLQEIKNTVIFDNKTVKELLGWYLNFRKQLVGAIRQSRQKDYENPFRQMLYADTNEMEAVMGKLDDTPFIKMQEEKLEKDTSFLEKWIETI